MPAAEARTGVLVAAVLLLALNLRIGVTSVSSLLEILVRAHVLNGTTALLITAAPSLIFGLTSAPAAACERRWGQNLTTSVAVILVAAGLAVRFVADPYLMLIGTVVTCLGVAALNVILPAMIQVHFPTHTSTMTTAYTTMMALGAAGAAFVSVPIADATGSTSIALGIWALPALLAVIAWVLAKHARITLGSTRARPTKSEPVESSPAYPAGTTLMVCFFALQILMSYVIIGWFPSIATDSGIPGARAGRLLAIIMVVGIPATMAIVPAARSLTGRRVGLCVTALMSIIGNLGMLLAPTFQPELWAVAVGIGMSGFPFALALLSHISSAPEQISRASAAAQTVGYLLGAGGPLLAGILQRATGSWSSVLLAMIVCAALQAAIGLALATASTTPRKPIRSAVVSSQR